jgi:hypothetical protein
MTSELDEARERYRKHLESGSPGQSPYYHDSYLGPRISLSMFNDLLKLARSACEAGEGDAKDAARYRMLRSQLVPHIVGDSHRHIYVASVEFYDEQDISGDELDAAIDAAMKGVRG